MISFCKTARVKIVFMLIDFSYEVICYSCIRVDLASAGDIPSKGSSMLRKYGMCPLP
jgi:hypothetical protein